MGQTFSSGNNVYVYLDRSNYYSGDFVSGQVLINCTTPFTCSQVVLKVEGEEKTHWHERHEHHDYDHDKKQMITRVEERTRSGEREFFKLKIPLYPVATQLQPGQYQFPFTLQLPEGLPGSFTFKDNRYRMGMVEYHNTSAKIKYKVKAECEVPGLTKPNLRHKAEMVVYQRLLRPPTEIKAQNHQDVRLCCCINKGSATITANVQKDTYLPGESAHVILQVDNSSSVAFDAINLKLHRLMELRSSGGAHRHLTDVLATASFPGVAPNSQFLGADARVLSLPLPSPMLPTTHGHLIKCDYQLEVELKAGCCLSDAELRVPLIIYNAAPEHVAYTAPPAFWNPAYIGQPVKVQLPPMPADVQTMESRVAPAYKIV